MKICREHLEASIRNNAGFTLIEVMVSMTIMALIMGVAFAGFSVGIDSWERGSQKIAELDHRFAMERLVQRQLALADPALFRGDSSQLELTSTYSLANGPGDLVQVKYSFDRDKLVYTETPAGYRAGISAPVASEMLEGLSQFGFSYLSTDDSGHPVWRATWTEEGLPIAVHVQIAGDALTIPLVNRQ
jgi:prepilin-type N-terminal cleavage/methylation domain-containing protein